MSSDDDTPEAIERPDPTAVQQLTSRLAGLSEPDPGDDSIWAPRAGRSDRDGELSETEPATPRSMLSASELDALAAAAADAARAASRSRQEAADIIEAALGGLSAGRRQAGDEPPADAWTEAGADDAIGPGDAWIDDSPDPDDLWEVAQSPPVRVRGPIVPLEIVIPIVVLALLIVVFVSWTS